jgi:hypothetical protein
MHPHRSLLRDRHGGRARALFTLVAPLGAEAPAAASTDMRTTDTAGQLPLFAAAGPASGAVAAPIGLQQHAGLRPGDVDCANDGITPRTASTPGSRTSATATRTTTTSRTSTWRWPSAERSGAGISYTELLAADRDCRRAKRNTPAARAWEANLEENLRALHEDLNAGAYAPGRSICFAITRPKRREVFAAGYRDRVVHHAWYRHVGPRFERAFIADSFACIPGRGTLAAARRLEAMVRAATHNWSRPASYLKCDLANFFPSIDKRILLARLERRIPEPFWRDLAARIVLHDPRENVERRGDPRQLALIPAAKSLFGRPAHLGLPIGNLSSQFGANVYLDGLDQFVKHTLRARHYVRYVDDFILLHDSPRQLNAWRAAIEAFLPAELGVQTNPAKTVLQPLSRGVDFVGQVIKPWRRTLRRRTLNEALTRLATTPLERVPRAAASYLGLARQASHSRTDRARIANVVRRRGFSVDHQLTKAYA